MGDTNLGILVEALGHAINCRSLPVIRKAFERLEAYLSTPTEHRGVRHCPTCQCHARPMHPHAVVELSGATRSSK